MAPETDLRSEFATLFVDEPPAPTVAHLVAGGRRRLRQRRLGRGLGVAVVIVAVATGYGAVSAGPDGERSLVTDNTSPDGPQPPGPTATTTYDSTDTEADADRVRGFSIDEATGEVTGIAGGDVRDALTLGEISQDSGAVAVDVVLDGDETWWYVDWSKDGSGSVNVAAQLEQPFSEWAQRMHQSQQSPPDPGSDGPPPLVATDSMGKLQIEPGVEVLQRIDNPLDLQAPYTSVAVEVRKGKDHFLAVLTPNGGSYGDPDKQTLQELIDEVRAGGPGYTAAGPMPPLWDLGAGGMPVIRPDAEVVRKVDNPLGLEPPRRSVAYVVRYDAKTWWALWELGPSGLNGAQTIRVAKDGYASIDDWLADQQAQVAW